MPLHKPQSYKPIQHLKGPSYRRRKRLGRKRTPTYINPVCDPMIYQYGQVVHVTHGPSREIEAWVREIRLLSDQKVDWHYVGGRARVLAIGDIERVIRTINNHPFLEIA